MKPAIRCHLDALCCRYTFTSITAHVTCCVWKTPLLRTLSCASPSSSPSSPACSFSLLCASAVSSFCQSSLGRRFPSSFLSFLFCGRLPSLLFPLSVCFFFSLLSLQKISFSSCSPPPKRIRFEHTDQREELTSTLVFFPASATRVRADSVSRSVSVSPGLVRLSNLRTHLCFPLNVRRLRLQPVSNFAKHLTGQFLLREAFAVLMLTGAARAKPLRRS